MDWFCIWSFKYGGEQGSTWVWRCKSRMSGKLGWPRQKLQAQLNANDKTLADANEIVNPIFEGEPVLA